MRASIYFPGSVSNELGLIRTTRPSSTCTMAVFVARAISSARRRARRRAGSASANSGVRACSTGFGFMVSRPSLAEQARAASCRRVPKRPRWAVHACGVPSWTSATFCLRGAEKLSRDELTIERAPERERL